MAVSRLEWTAGAWLREYVPHTGVSMRQFVTSKDGTKIAYETVGDGPTVLIVLGALNSRKSGTKLAKLLASKFTAVSYDRRGRGDSSDSASYAPEREVEDIAALIDAVGGPVFLYGHSSGAALAIAATVKLRKQVTKLAIYEAPFSLDSDARKAAKEYFAALKGALGWPQRRSRRPVRPIRGGV